MASRTPAVPLAGSDDRRRPDPSIMWPFVYWPMIWVGLIHVGTRVMWLLGIG